MECLYYRKRLTAIYRTSMTHYGYGSVRDKSQMTPSISYVYKCLEGLKCESLLARAHHALSRKATVSHSPTDMVAC